MPRSSGDDRPPLVIAMQWVQQVTAISLEMALPAGLGYWLDNRWGTSPWLVAVGAVFGFTVAMRHLLDLAGRASKQNRSRPSRSGDPHSKP